MAAQIINGKALSAEHLAGTQEAIIKFKARGIVPGLAVIIVGENPASMKYVANKEKICQSIGIYSRIIRMPAHTPQAEIETTIRQLNEESAIHGILVQLPLPPHLSTLRLLSLINPAKDVDGFHYQNSGKLFYGLPSLLPGTPKGVHEMIKSTGVTIAGKDAVVVGRSNIVGKPMAIILMNEDATVSVCHKLTADLKAYTSRADILVVAAGKPKLITADMVKPGAVVIDVGITYVDGKVVGDVDFQAVSEVAGFITPVPGGVGRMTVAMLMANTVEAAASIEAERLSSLG
ncbi:MAG: bifunctional 5,10-methylene-tetrahydrofolate dehydrogenase/5,10-methylene-tetrahydrofolate cyclohydrolase [Clostridia bacterium]|nr:bifunctional 5,10-methylene-tetrahydrofolate dehydrogenase/5,10-methylene-tetrahydrofolate cyclohydrolase [Clostridia bacterium]